MIVPNIWENKKWQPNHQPVVSCGSDGDEIDLSPCQPLTGPNQGFESVVPVHLGYSTKICHLPNHGSSDGENGDGDGDGENKEPLTMTRN